MINYWNSFQLKFLFAFLKQQTFVWWLIFYCNKIQFTWKFKRHDKKNSKTNRYSRVLVSNWRKGIHTSSKFILMWNERIFICTSFFFLCPNQQSSYFIFSIAFFFCILNIFVSYIKEMLSCYTHKQAWNIFVERGATIDHRLMKSCLYFLIFNS